MENSSFIKKALHGIPVLITWLFILAGAVEAVWGLPGVSVEGGARDSFCGMAPETDVLPFGGL